MIMDIHEESGFKLRAGKWMFCMVIITLVLTSFMIKADAKALNEQASRINRDQALIIIDGSLEGIDQLLKGTSEGANVVVLNPKQDGIMQITDVIQHYRKIRALHIVSHGSSGCLQLGNRKLNLNNIDRYETVLQMWSHTLVDEADILLYGCQVGDGEQGQAFIQRLSVLTGADVAASSNLTGCKAQDGDWVLEESTGVIETVMPFNGKAVPAYSYVLDGTTRYWDGGGSDNKWGTKENWSGDKIPDATDHVVIDGTCNDNIVIDSNRAVYSFTVESEYDGNIIFLNTPSFIVGGDVLIKGGTIGEGGTRTVNGHFTVEGGDVSWGGTIGGNFEVSRGTVDLDDDTTIGGDFEVSGGTVDLNDDTTIKGSAAIKGGTVSFATGQWYDDYFYGGFTHFYGNFNYTDGTVESSQSVFRFHNSGTQTLNATGGALSIHTMIIEKDKTEGAESPQALNINGDISLAAEESIFKIDDSAITVNLDGNLTFTTHSNTSEFMNRGTLNIQSGSVLDVNQAGKFNNYGTIVEDGIIKRGAKMVLFTDENGNVLDTLAVGDPFYITLEDEDEGLTDHLETCSVTVKSLKTGDEEKINLIGTGVGSKIFRNTSGFFTQAGAANCNDNILQYDGTEDLQVIYTDDEDADDTIRANLIRKPIVWDGGGEDNKWRTAANWEGDVVPGMVDSVIFDGTSSKNAQIDSPIEVKTFTVTEDYSGQISITNSPDITINGDAVIQSGTITGTGGLRKIKGNFTVENATVNWGHIEVDKDTMLSNATAIFDDFETVWINHPEFRGNLLLKNSLVKFYSEEASFYGDFIVEGEAGTIDTSWTRFWFYPSGESTFDLGAKGIDIAYLDIWCGDRLDIYGDVRLNRSNSQFSNKADTHIHGEISFTDENGGRTFENEGTLTIEDGAVLDARQVKTYNNSKTIVQAGTGKVLRFAKGVLFSNESGEVVKTLAAGNPLYVTLYDDDENITNLKDTCSVIVKSLVTGDEEELELTETGTKSKVFRNASGFPTEAVAASCNDGTLQYDGTEDLQVIYSDDEDAADTISANLIRKPIVWDGGGADDKWTTKENWAGDCVPGALDSVVFDETSSSVVIDTNVEIVDFKVESAYTGTIRSENNVSVTINGDMLVQGGTIEGNYPQYTVLGNATVEDGQVCLGGNIQGQFTVKGGEVTIKSSINFRGDVYIEGGSVTFIGNNSPCFYGKKIICSGGSISAKDSFLQIRYSGDMLIDLGEQPVRAKGLWFWGNNSNVTLKGNIQLVKTDSAFQIWQETASVTLNGDIIFTDAETGYTRNAVFKNVGTLTIQDGSTIDARLVDIYENSGTIEEVGSGKIVHMATAMGVIDEAGVPALDDFKFSQPLIVTLKDQDRNLKAGEQENLTVTLKNWTNGDEEIMTLTETANDSGEFRSSTGYVTAASDTGTSHNDIFEGQGADVVTDAVQMIYRDPKFAADEYVVSINCPEIGIAITELSMDTVEVGTDGSQSFVIANQGDINLEITDMHIEGTDAGDFHFEGIPDTSDIVPDGERTYKVIFEPTSTGHKTASLVIKTNDFDEDTIIIELSGKSCAAPTTTGIDDVTVQEGVSETQINLYDAFDDLEDTDDKMTYKIAGNTNGSLFNSVHIDDDAGILTLRYGDGQSGTADVTVRSTDTDGLFVETVFSVTVIGNDNAGLSDIDLSCGSLRPAFSEDQLMYTVNVDTSVTRMDITLTPIDENVSLKINDQTATKDVPQSVLLDYGSTTIQIVVTARDGITSKTYTLTVDREMPTITASGFTPEYIEESESVVIDKNLTLTGSTLDGAQVKIADGFVSTEDVLEGINQYNITGSYNAGTGTFTLTGEDTIEHYQTVLRSVKYRNSNSNNPDTTSRKIVFSIGSANLGSAQVMLNITPVNDVPTISSVVDTSTDEDSTVGPISFTVGDVDTSLGSLILQGNSSNTTLVNNTSILFGGSGSERTMTITPVENQSGIATITLTVSDGIDTARQSFILIVNAVNDAPSFSKGMDISVNKGSREQSIKNWAKNILQGPNEAGQVINFIVDNDNNSLFSVQPAISQDGTMSFTAVEDIEGTAAVNVCLKDDGGTVGEGVDTSEEQSFMITVDTIAPTVSLTKNNENFIVRDTDKVTITATFSELMANTPKILLDVADGSGADINSVNMTGSGTTWTYIWNVPEGHDGNATVTVAGNDMAGNVYTGEAELEFTIDNTLPVITISEPSLSSTNNGPVTYAVNYSGADSVVLANGDVTLNSTGTAYGNITVTGEGTTTRIITINDITGDGTLGISVAAGTASDTAGNKALAAGPSTIFMVDTTAPVITLQGDSEITVYKGSHYIEQGATAIDNDDGDLSQQITISSNVDTMKAGSYTVTYQVADAAGNRGIQTRTVFVKVKPVVPTAVVTVDDGNRADAEQVEQAVNHARLNGNDLLQVEVNEDTDNMASVGVPLRSIATEQSNTIGVRVETGDTIMEVPEGAVDTSQVADTDHSYLELVSEIVDMDAPENEEMAESMPQDTNVVQDRIFDFRMSVVDGQGNRDLIENFASDEEIMLGINISDQGIISSNMQNLITYYYHENVGAGNGDSPWEYVGGEYDTDTQSMMFYTDHLSTYGIMKVADKAVALIEALNREDDYRKARRIIEDDALGLDTDKSSDYGKLSEGNKNDIAQGIITNKPAEGEGYTGKDQLKDTFDKLVDDKHQDLNKDTEKPVITLNGEANIQVASGSQYKELGAKARDNMDGDISGRIVITGDTVDTNTLGSYTIRYHVTDMAGNVADEVTRTVTVVDDSVKPEIELIGDANMFLYKGQEFIDPGVKATDNLDEDIAYKVIVSGDKVDTGTVGIYTIYYDVTDASGKAAEQVTRTVRVKKKHSHSHNTTDTTPDTNTVINNSKTFEDIQGHWAQEDIEIMASKLIVKGKDERTFDPNGKVTRAEFAAMIVRVLEIPEKTTTVIYNDVSDEWFADIIGAATKAKLFKGYGDGTFKPNQVISREEIAAVLSRAVEYSGLSVDITDIDGELQRFKDQQQIKNWAKEPVAKAVEAKIIQGNEQGCFEPDHPATRAESVVMLLRMLKHIGFMI